MSKQRCFIFFSLMIVYLSVQLSLFARDKNDSIKEFKFTDDGYIIISIESAKKRDGQTPVTLFVNGISAEFRLDESGRLTGMNEGEDKKGTLTLNPEIGQLVLGNSKNTYPVTRYEKNPIRTRFKLKTGDAQLILRLNRETNQGEILLGKGKEKIGEFDFIFKANPAGYEELILPGQCQEDLAYDSSTGTIILVYKRDSSGNIQKGRNWAKRVGETIFKGEINEK
ncbi:MAG: hypothetical protein KAT34_13735 [Candidatus Aminicenantes bacterium]|nr:hypothetical protein [Candidatus Aminicenantes bacterium]